MPSKAFKRIKAGLEEAVAYSKGDTRGARVTRVQVGPSRAEQVAVATLEAIAAADQRSKGGPCVICRCPQHAGHKSDCPVGLAVRALETIANLKAMGA